MTIINLTQYEYDKLIITVEKPFITFIAAQSDRTHRAVLRTIWHGQFTYKQNTYCLL